MQDNNYYSNDYTLVTQTPTTGGTFCVIVIIKQVNFTGLNGECMSKIIDTQKKKKKSHEEMNAKSLFRRKWDSPYFISMEG